MEADLKSASEQLVLARRERIKDLYASERFEWQEELASRGLAMATANE